MWVQASIKEKIFKVAPISGARNPSDLETKALPGPRVRQLLHYSGARLEDGTQYGQEDAEEAEQKAMIRQIVTNGVKKPAFKNVLPILLVLAQVVGSEGAVVEGLSLGLAMASFEKVVFEASYVISSILVKAFILLAAPFGILWLIWVGLKRAMTTTPPKPEAKQPTQQQAEIGVQAVIKSREEQAWADEYVNRANYLSELLAECRRENEQMGTALRNAREELRALRANRPQVPARLSVAVSRGRVFHLPGCHSLRSSGNVRSFTACQYCFPGATG